MTEKKQRTKKYFAPQNEGQIHACDYPGCHKKGEYRAPKDKSLKEYYWFCLDHVAEYNAKWNYYDNEDNLDAEESLKHKMHFGGFSSKIKYQFGYDFIDELGDSAFINHAREHIYFNAQNRQSAEQLDISLENLDVATLKKQYKKLARKYHPDMNAGNKECEEKFKKITTAYHDLMQKLQHKN